MNLRESSLLPASEAASRLQVHPSRVRALIREGVLDGEKVGGRWFVDAWSLERRRAMEAPGGRPFSRANAWALLNLWSGRTVDWVNKWERSRLRRRLRERDLRELAPRLRSRAALERLRVHPGLLARVADARGVFRSGISAAARYAIDIVPRDELEIYVRSDRLEELKEEYGLESSQAPNLIVHVVEGPWELPHERGLMSPLVAALDLIESPDERCRRAGEELLERLVGEDRQAE